MIPTGELPVVLKRQDSLSILFGVHKICRLDDVTKISFFYRGGAKQNLTLALLLTYQLNQYGWSDVYHPREPGQNAQNYAIPLGFALSPTDTKYRTSSEPYISPQQWRE